MTMRRFARSAGVLLALLAGSGTEPGPCREHGGPPRRVGEWWRRFRNWLER